MTVGALIFLSAPPPIFIALSLFYLHLTFPLKRAVRDTDTLLLSLLSPTDPWEIFPPAGPLPSPAHTSMRTLCQPPSTFTSNSRIET